MVFELISTYALMVVVLAGLCSRFGASWGFVLAGVGLAFVVPVAIGFVGLRSSKAQDRRYEAFRSSIEVRYPGMRAREIAQRKWRIEDAQSGRLECVLDADGVTVLSIRGQSVCRLPNETTV